MHFLFKFRYCNNAPHFQRLTYMFRTVYFENSTLKGDDIIKAVLITLNKEIRIRNKYSILYAYRYFI